MSSDRPVLVVREHGGGVRLNLGALAHGDGPTSQEAADDLLRRVLIMARALRTGGTSAPRELAQDVAALSFLYELDEIHAAGGDVRARLFGA